MTEQIFEIKRISEPSDSNLCRLGRISTQLVDDTDYEPLHRTAFPNEVGYLKYRKSQDNTIFISDVEVDENFQNRKIAIKMYKELCKIIKECNEDTKRIEYIKGEVRHVAALKARNKIFGNPLEVFDYNKKQISNKNAIEMLKSIKTKVYVMNNTKRCR